MNLISKNGIPLHETTAKTEQGAWNLFFQLHPKYLSKSIRELNRLGYKVRKIT